MEISEDLLCLFSTEVEQKEGSYVIEVPEQELTLGDIDGKTTYRVALLPTATPSKEGTSSQRQASQEPVKDQDQGDSGPPVEEGEQRTVEIEDIGEQGDGIARVERGYVIIVPDTEPQERVTVEINTVKENVSFADVIERKDYYE